jgi:hypothetical protein
MNLHTATLRAVFLLSAFLAVLMLLSSSQRRQQFEADLWLHVGVSAVVSMALLALLVHRGQLRVSQRLRLTTFAFVYTRALAITFVKLFGLVAVVLGATIAIATGSLKDGLALGVLIGLWFAAGLSPAVASVVVARSLSTANDA